MSGLWASLKGQEGPSTNIANDELIEESDPVRGAPVRAPARSVAFKPVTPVTMEEALRMSAVQLDANDDAEPSAMITLEQQSERLPMMDASDLLAEDLTPVGGLPGRPRVFKNNAQRQKAYRLRRKFGDLI